ncbi:13414_t:CDS:1 [Acaulospora colombiana]|uniref:13414_t:CDS:1 n=1 Tax=Acaulospora colombiana TaxID=27376 RepID=A0ACA9LLQ5_9GLOM|nr:13414_t:CDS:1 [Acaulospora colombiana]
MSTAAIAIGLTVGLLVLFFVFVLLFFKLRRGRNRTVPIDILAHKNQSKSATSSNSSLRPSKKSSTRSSHDFISEKSKTQKNLFLQLETQLDPSPKTLPQQTPPDPSGPPIGDSPRSSQEVRRDKNASPRRNSPHSNEERTLPIPRSQSPQNSQVLIEGNLQDTDEVPYYTQKPPQIPPNDPSPPSSPVRSSRSLDRPGYSPDEDNPGPYPPAQPAQKRGLSRSSRQRSPYRARGGRSSSSNS